MNVTIRLDRHSTLNLSGHNNRSEEINITGMEVNILDGIDRLNLHPIRYQIRATINLCDQ